MEVLINNIIWKVKFIRGSSEDLRRYDGSYTIGMTDNNQKTIFINKGLKGDLLYKVLCHEIVHAFCFSYDIEMSEEEEERLASFITYYGIEIFEIADQIYSETFKNKQLMTI